jgi:CBS domain containing-hemolysin-like protein
MEASLLSITPAFIESKVKEGKKYAKRLKFYKNNIDLPLSAILTVNTFAHTLGAAGVGAQALQIWGNAYVSFISFAVTLIILIFSEIIPKTLGATYWKSLAPFTANAISALIYSPFYPFVIMVKSITMILKRNKDESILSRDEFKAIAEKSIKDGLFDHDESKILMNVMLLEKIEAKAIMTPRTILECSSEDVSISDFFQNNEIKFSRIPVYKDTVDNITGYVLKDEIKTNVINNAGENMLACLKRPMLTVNDQIPVLKLLNKMLNQKEHIALVVGEYGETAGIVTLEDILETIIGSEIVDENDEFVDMQSEAREKYLRNLSERIYQNKSRK